MKKLYLLSSSLLFLVGLLSAQTYSTSGGSIPNNGAAVYYPIEVSNLFQTNLNTVFGIESVTVKITHTFDQELDLKLISPDDREILLSHSNGGSGDNYYITTFNDFATTSIVSGSAPFNGTYKPQQPLGVVNDGMDGSGTWQLYVKDLSPNNNNTGYMIGWSITFGYNPGPVFHFSSSNLPIVVIDTRGQYIPDDPKIPVDFLIIDNGPGQRNFLADTAVYSGIVGIELRGSSSQQFPKKSYGFETWDIFGQSIDTSLLGMPAESDWILNANYTDKSFCRNVMAYQSWMNMGHYATRYKFVEVVINGEYLGVYIFSEKVKRNKQRVDIAKLLPDENSGDPLTGGYILKVDKSTGSGGDGWVSPFPPPVNPSGQYIFIQYEYPGSDEITPQQKSYIQDYVTDFEAALEGPFFSDTAVGFRKYAQELTFIDYFLVNEISKNVDGYRLSTFFHKEQDSKGGKIRMGPVWDYDIAWHNADYCDGSLYTGWAYQFPCAYDYWQVPFWWARLLQDPLYASHLKCRWLELRSNFLSNAYFENYIDSVAAHLSEAEFRNFNKWPILGVYVWPNPYPLPQTYAEEISTLKSWLMNRLQWMDEHLPGTCYTVGSEEPIIAQLEWSIYPNPVQSVLSISCLTPVSGFIKAELINESGLILLSRETTNSFPAGYKDQFDLSELSPGIYFLRITSGQYSTYRKVVKI